MNYNDSGKEAKDKREIRDRADMLLDFSQPTITYGPGFKMNLANPLVEQIDIETIAKNLDRIPRFCAQGETIVTVLQHSLNVMLTAIEESEQSGEEYAPETLLALLLHDAAEAYIGDLIHPLKQLCPVYAAAERRLLKVIGQKFDINFEEHASVIREFDMACLVAERDLVFPDEIEVFDEHEVDGVKQITVRIVPSEKFKFSNEDMLAQVGWPVYGGSNRGHVDKFIDCALVLHQSVIERKENHDD